jgi:hypothetical protein
MTSGSITEFGTERTIEQLANMQRVIDWLAKVFLLSSWGLQNRDRSPVCCSTSKTPV